MKLRKLCELCNVDYNVKNPKRSLNKIKKQYIIEEYKPHNYNIIGMQPSKMNISRFENQFQIPQKYIHKAGIYKIELNNDIYVGQTIDFYKRFMRHRHGFNNTTKEMLNNGAVMTMLELEDDKIKRLEKETTWSYHFLKQGFNMKNDFRVLYKNKKESNNSNNYKNKKESNNYKNKKDYKNKKESNDFSILKIKKSQFEEAKKILFDNNIEFKIRGEK